MGIYQFDCVWLLLESTIFFFLSLSLPSSYSLLPLLSSALPLFLLLPCPDFSHCIYLPFSIPLSLCVSVSLLRFLSLSVYLSRFYDSFLSLCICLAFTIPFSLSVFRSEGEASLLQELKLANDNLQWRLQQRSRALTASQGLLSSSSPLKILV